RARRSATSDPRPVSSSDRGATQRGGWPRATCAPSRRRPVRRARRRNPSRRRSLADGSAGWEGQRMPDPSLHLHDLIDIGGMGSEPYKAHTGQLGTGRRDGGAPLVGTWQQSGSTGTWPMVVNLWEMRGWDHWAEILERQYTRASGQEPALKRWWKEA